MYHPTLKYAQWSQNKCSGNWASLLEEGKVLDQNLDLDVGTEEKFYKEE